MPDILIVEDNPVNQKLIAFLLARANYTYEVAENGQVALELLRRSPFRLVLMDMMMPVMNGFEAIRAMRADPALAKIPVIALTANALKGEDDKCRAAGCNDYIAKPYSKEQVLNAIARLLGGAQVPVQSRAGTRGVQRKPAAS
jgi:two-component system sensor histidine kinase/response regulator